MILDECMAFIAHVDDVRNKVHNVMQKITRISITLLEKLVERRRRICNLSFWKKFSFMGTKSSTGIALDRIHRSCVLLVTKEYRTVSLVTLLILASVLPIKCTAHIRKALYVCKKGVSNIELLGWPISKNDMYGPLR